MRYKMQNYKTIDRIPAVKGLIYTLNDTAKLKLSNMPTKPHT